MKTLFRCSMLALALLCSCTTTRVPNRQIRRFFHDLSAICNRRDAEALSRTLHTECTLIFISPAGSVHSRQKVTPSLYREDIENYWAPLKDYAYSNMVREIEIDGNTVTVEIYVTETFERDGKPMRKSAKEIVLLIETEDGLKAKQISMQEMSR